MGKLKDMIYKTIGDKTIIKVYSTHPTYKNNVAKLLAKGNWFQDQVLEYIECEVADWQRESLIPDVITVRLNLIKE